MMKTILLSYLSYDVASGSDITSCININKPLVVYRFSGNVMPSIIMLSTQRQNNFVYARNKFFKVICHMISIILKSCSCIIEFIKLVAKKR